MTSVFGSAADGVAADQWPVFTATQAASWLRVPAADDDKYSHGVLGAITGSDRFPGAAVLGVEAAWRASVGMVRYLGPTRPAGAVLARRPETVLDRGRVQAWLIGSGMSGLDPELGTEGYRPGEFSGDVHASEEDAIDTALRQQVPTVLDAGAIPLVRRVAGVGVITPHHGELAALLGVDRASVTRDPHNAALAAWNRFGVTVLLKGSETVVAGRRLLRLPVATPWLATAGTGDVLAGILGALLATHAHELDGDDPPFAELAATAATLHALAAERALERGPFTALDLAEALPTVLRDLLP